MLLKPFIADPGEEKDLAARFARFRSWSREPGRRMGERDDRSCPVCLNLAHDPLLRFVQRAVSNCLRRSKGRRG